LYCAADSSAIPAVIFLRGGRSFWFYRALRDCASHAAQVQSRVKTTEKIERIVVPPDPKEMKVRFAPVDRSDDIVVKMGDL
jgi:hypothetical protein